MKLLIASTPVIGHLNPLLAIGRMAMSRGDDVVVTTASYLRAAVEGSGARFIPLGPGADLDYSRREEAFPEMEVMPPGPEQLLIGMKRAFIDTIAPQAATLRAAIAAEWPDILVVDDFFGGATALFLDRTRDRPPIVACSITIMTADRPDGAPAMLGLPPAQDAAARQRYAAIAEGVAASFTRPLQLYADAKLREMGLPPLPSSFMNSRHQMADAFLMSTVPSFEYDFETRSDHIHFVGALPLPPARDTARPDWLGELDGGKRLVLVTQGTAANTDFGELVEPAIAALADRTDVLVLVTTGRRPLANVRGPIPSNVRMAEFLDYEALIPKLDLLVTNGGYGTVSLALRAGVPIVAAGRTEDKAEVGARVAWSGVGIEIPSQRASVSDLAAAISRVLEEPQFRQRARTIAEEMAAIDTPAVVLGIFDDLVRQQAGRVA